MGVTAGSRGGPRVVLLHGFPEFWFSWREQLPALANAGRTPLALDLRGYNRSSKPRGVAAYRMDRLVEDVAVVIGPGQIGALVGHDWGGVIAWRVVDRYPDRVERLVVINAPHPRTFAGYLRRHPRRWLRSWYMALFQLPWLPERLIRANGYRAIRRWPPLRPREYVEPLERPGALTSALNYYRAAFRFGSPRGRLHSGSLAPWQSAGRDALVIWGRRDAFLEPALARPPEAYDARIEYLAEAGHWPHLQMPERVNQLLTSYLGDS